MQISTGRFLNRSSAEVRVFTKDCGKGLSFNKVLRVSPPIEKEFGTFGCSKFPANLFQTDFVD